MIEIDGVKYELAEGTFLCDGCELDDFDNCCKTNCYSGDYILKRIKEEVMFEKGDRVVCVDNSGAPSCFTIGKKYVIAKIGKGVSGCQLIDCISDNGHMRGMYEHRFKLIKPAPQYTTRPIDYTGCDPVIAEHLQRGESILCECTGGGGNINEELISSYCLGSEYMYESLDCAFTNAKPIPRKRTETRVKKASEIVAWLEDNEYKVDCGGHWNGPKIGFANGMFQYCGAKPSGTFDWLPEWLEEVEM